MENYLREEQIRTLLQDESAFRARQAYDALFSPAISGWEGASALSKEMRERLLISVPWNMFKPVAVLPSKHSNTWKALLAAQDDARIETVLMKNSRGQFTVCVSTQVGCAMNCSFCATGRLGFTRNLSSDEIVDQVRFWKDFLRDKSDIASDITNIVYMGMGEPLANYENVRESLVVFTTKMGFGLTRITVSTVGLVPMLERLLDDPEWPAVRLAVSLHSADPRTRKELMPTSYDDFLEKLATWATRYFEIFDTNRRHLTFEYILLAGVNDTEKHANALIRFSRRVGKVRVNLIPYNYTDDQFGKPTESAVIKFQNALKTAGIIAMRRRAMGNDIAAACGQLAGSEKK